MASMDGSGRSPERGVMLAHLAEMLEAERDDTDPMMADHLEHIVELLLDLGSQVVDLTAWRESADEELDFLSGLMMAELRQARANRCPRHRRRRCPNIGPEPSEPDA